MSQPFPYPGENVSSFVDLINHANVLTSGFLGVGILITIGIISFISTKNYTTDKALGFSSFVTLLVAFLLRFMRLIDDAVLYIVIIIFVSVVVWLLFQREEESTT